MRDEEFVEEASDDNVQQSLDKLLDRKDQLAGVLNRYRQITVGVVAEKEQTQHKITILSKKTLDHYTNPAFLNNLTIEYR